MPDEASNFIQRDTRDPPYVAPEDQHDGVLGSFAMGTPGTPVQPISRSPEEEEKAR